MRHTRFSLSMSFQRALRASFRRAPVDSKKRVPAWLYQALPFVYSLVGAMAIGYFESPTGFNAGILLLFAAFLIWMMRNDNKP